MKTLQKVSPLSVMQGGMQAFKNVNGLKQSVWKAFFFNYGIFLVLLFVLNFLVYIYAIEPLMTMIFGDGSGWFGTVGTVLMGILQIFTGALFAIASLRISLALMGLWYEHLASLVVSHFRPLPQKPFTLAACLRLVGESIGAMFKELGLLLLLLMLSFVPVIGIGLAFILGSYLMGREVKAPYFSVIESSKDTTVALGKKLRGTVFVLGVLQMLLAFVPMVGWLALPLLAIYQIVGFAYSLEKAHASVSS